MTATVPRHEPLAPEASPRSVPASRWMSWLLGWPLPTLIGLWCLAVLAIWLPQYLLLPLFTDHDHFAMLAQSWDLGVLPYRSHHSNQFPGELYLFGVLGKLTGWGQARPFYALDAAMVAVFGLMLGLWSRRHLGRALYGLVGFAVLLSFYTSEAYELTGQREWHVMFWLVLSLLALWPGSGRPGLWISALAFALALLTRPQAVLAAPGLLLSLVAWSSGRARGGPAAGATRVAARTAIGPILLWGSLVTGGFALGLMPLAWSGLLNDFVREVTTTRLAIGRGYAGPGSIRLRIMTHLALLGRHPQFLVLPLAALILSGAESGARRWYHRGLVLAALGVGGFQAVSPAEHRYYEIPPQVITAVLAAVVTAQFADRLDRPDAVLASLMVVAVLAGWTPRPTYTSVTAARRAVADLRSGSIPVVPPPLYWDYEGYTWPDIQAALEYLRRTTSPETPVTSLCHSGTAIVSAIPRRQGLPVDFLLFVLSGGAHREQVLRALRDTTELVVVWNPTVEEPHYPELADVFQTVRAYYEPDWTFGPLEIWRHRDAAATSRQARVAHAP